jgi:membrane dipeptidase
MILVKSGFDLDKIIENKKLAGLLAIEGADFLGDDLFLIDLVHHLGVRLITLVWNGRNSIADGVKVRENAGGLTGIGTQAVKRMQELGIIVDVSHLSEKGFWDVSRVTSRAFVASHSNARAVCDHPRNLWDDQIREIAKNKGLIGMNLCRPFVAAQEEDQTLATVIRHISHIADVAGTEVLCLGCDLDGIREMPTGMADVRDVVRIADLLGEAGFLPAEIEAITSKNLLRFVKNNLE